MTNQEALNKSKERLDKYRKDSSRDLSLFGDRVKSFCEEMIEYYELVVRALEKQIPQKPDYEGDGYADGKLVYDTWICPNCGREYEVDYDNYNYCPECGQSLDLEDEEDGDGQEEDNEETFGTDGTADRPAE